MSGHFSASDLPDSLKPLVHRQAVEVRQLHFDRDAEALVERVREALNGGSVGLRSWQGTMVADVADGDEEPFRITQATLEVDPVTVREALNGGSVLLRSWLGTAVAGVAAAAGLLLVGWIGLHWMTISVWPLLLLIRAGHFGEKVVEIASTERGRVAARFDLDDFVFGASRRVRPSSSAARAFAASAIPEVKWRDPDH